MVANGRPPGVCAKFVPAFVRNDEFTRELTSGVTLELELRLGVTLDLELRLGVTGDLEKDLEKCGVTCAGAAKCGATCGAAKCGATCGAAKCGAGRGALKCAAAAGCPPPPPPPPLLPGGGFAANAGPAAQSANATVAMIAEAFQLVMSAGALLAILCIKIPSIESHNGVP